MEKIDEDVKRFTLLISEHISETKNVQAKMGLSALLHLWEVGKLCWTLEANETEATEKVKSNRKKD